MVTEDSVQGQVAQRRKGDGERVSQKKAALVMVSRKQKEMRN